MILRTFLWLIDQVNTPERVKQKEEAYNQRFEQEKEEQQRKNSRPFGLEDEPPEDDPW